jgi:hypothetical protein
MTYWLNISYNTLSVGLISYEPRHKDVWGSGGTAPTFLASALITGEWSDSRFFRFTPEGKEPPPSIVYEAGWGPEPVWMLWKRENLVPLTGIETQLLSRPARIFLMTFVID